ncbi:MAG: glycoside hydrolase family 20 zincin-like fold domain-containing protein [Bryobacteraceae bacterium]
MRSTWAALVLCLAAWLIPLSSPASGAGAVPLSGQASVRWMRWLLPLPHEVRLDRKMVVPRGRIQVTLRPGAGPVERQAAGELSSILGATDGAPLFTILVGIQDKAWPQGALPESRRKRLESLPNRDQAYAILPAADSALLLTALDGKGVYYAARTLSQLLETSARQQDVDVPLADITDWPDMEERGLWNFPDPANWVPWMTSLKLNYGKMSNTQLKTVERGGRNGVVIETPLYELARRQAMQYMPYLIHLNFLDASGLFRAYPELAGRGDAALAGRYFAHKRGSQHRAPFAAHPQFQKIVQEWLEDMAAQGVDEVSCWLSERPAEDQRPETTAVGQFVLAGRALVNAWREVRQRHPQFRIRLFLSTVTTERDYRVVAEAPPEVRIERACATALERVTHLPRDLFRYPLLDHYAAEGRWVASYDVPIGANARVDTPEYKVPQTSVHRVRDYLVQLSQRRYRGAYGMLAWSRKARETYGFSTAALAEYGWNLNGRGTRAFATAWATREGMENPEAFGEWSEIMGPIEFDVYDSEFPVAYSWGKFIQLIRERRRPYLGEGVFRYYTNPRDFSGKIAACDRAMAIAERFQNPYFADETRIVRSYVRLAQWLYEIAEQVSLDSLESLASQDKLRKSLRGLEAAGEENANAIRLWRNHLGPADWDRPPQIDSSVQRVLDAIQGTRTTVSEIKDFLEGRYFY